MSPNTDSDGLLRRAVEKHNRFNVISRSELSYSLLYQDKSEVKTLPGRDEKFTLQRYKEEIDKSYNRVTFYLCSTDDFLDHLMYAMDAGQDDNEFDTSDFES